MVDGALKYTKSDESAKSCRCPLFNAQMWVWASFVPTVGSGMPEVEIAELVPSAKEESRSSQPRRKVSLRAEGVAVSWGEGRNTAPPTTEIASSQSSSQ